MLDQITIHIINSDEGDDRISYDSPSLDYMRRLFSMEELASVLPWAPFFTDDPADQGPLEVVEKTVIRSGDDDVYPLTVTIDPGYSFGDGRHATTWLCVKYLVEYLAAVPRPERSGLSLLDAGTGTGVLAIAAAKLGIHDIDAFDIYHHAVQCAKNNCLRNDCAYIRVCESDIAAFNPGRAFDIVMANLVSDVIIANLDALVRLAAPGGVIIASGVSSGKIEIMQDYFRRAGLDRDDSTVRDGWCGFLLRRA